MHPSIRQTASLETYISSVHYQHSYAIRATIVDYGLCHRPPAIGRQSLNLVDPIELICTVVASTNLVMDITFETPRTRVLVLQKRKRTQTS